MNRVKGEEGEGIIVGGLHFSSFDEEAFYGFLVWSRSPPTVVKQFLNY